MIKLIKIHFNQMDVMCVLPLLLLGRDNTARGDKMQLIFIFLLGQVTGLEYSGEAR